MAQFGYLNNFQSIMEMAGLLNNQQVSEFIENVVFSYQSGPARNTDGFNVLPLKPAFEMTYAAIQKNTNLQVMAKHVAIDAHAVPNPTPKVEALEGTIPHIATNITLGKEDYLEMARKELMSRELTGFALFDAAQDWLSKSLDAKFAEHNARASYMRDYVVFNGKYNITSENNAGSFYNIEFDFGVPAGNKTTLSGNYRWWTNDTYTSEGSDSDPIADIDNKVMDLMDRGFTKDAIEIEVGYKTLQRLGRHSKVREGIAIFMNPNIGPRTSSQKPTLAATTYGMSDEQLQFQLAARLGVSFKVRNFVTTVPVFDQKTGQFVEEPQSGFAEDVLVIRPKGEIGEVHGTGHLLVGGEGDTVHSCGLYDGGRILVDYNCNLRERVQIWDTEETFLYVLNQAKNMFYLTVK